MVFRLTSSWEVWAVTYAIAAGAVARGIEYLHQFPGYIGWIMAAACTSVVFLVGGYLLDHARGRTASAGEQSLQGEQMLSGEENDRPA